MNFNLREDFSIPHVALRIWGLPPRDLEADRAEYAAVSDQLKAHAAALAHPFCGPDGNAEAAEWFGEAAAHVRSVAHIALRETGVGAGSGACIGMLAMGSEDTERFYPGMGILYLSRLGELAGSALSRFA